MKNTSLIITTMLFLIAMLFAVQNPATARVEKTYRIGIASRIEFAPLVLDMVREELSKKLLSFPATLSFIAPDDFQKPDFNPDFDCILVENGLSTEHVSSSFRNSGINIVMAWVLAVRGDAVKLTSGRISNLQDFVDILKKLRSDSPYKFPWFEPLCSRAVMRNFCHIIGEASSDSSKRGAIGFLYQCIEEELLNPMSVEADLALANSVFHANDTFFSSTWVPLARFFRNADLENDIQFLPFPDVAGQARLPVITLELWQKQSLPAIASYGVSLPDDVSKDFLELDLASDSRWFNEKYQEQYDRLIMGDF